PALKSQTVTADDHADNQLAQRLKNLSPRPQAGAGKPSNVLGKASSFESNSRKLESITLQNSATDGAVTLISRIDGTDHAIVCGRGSWKKQRAGWGKLTEQPLAASGAWTDDATFVAKLCFYETPTIVTVTMKF